MSDSLKILFISAEVAPFAKTGGLGDVGGSLPKALKAMDHDIRVVMPAYQKIEDGHFADVVPLDLELQVPIDGGLIPAGVFEGRLPGSDVPIYFIANWHLFKRPSLYGFWDDPYRFAFFSRAALELAKALDWRPDVVHGQDWHAAPALTWLATAGRGDEFFHPMPTVFTIHNLAIQGNTNWHIFDYMGIQTHSLAEEPYGEVNLMARGIYHATMVNTVSPTYSLEIMTKEGGAGIDGVLRHRHFDLHGILNGIDYDTWNPATDPNVPAHFTVDSLDERVGNRRALQERVGLPQRDDIPLVAMVSRLTWQKGLDLMGPVIHQLMSGFSGEAQFVLLGTGDYQYENMFATMAGYHQDKMTAVLAYEADLAPLIYAGSDIFLMPSLFEPCGLGQLIAMRYGSVPLVRHTGGLADTVQEPQTGFVFHNFSTEDFWHALQRAIYVYNMNKSHWRQIQENGMKSDFSWERSAGGYQQLYQWALARTYE